MGEGDGPGVQFLPPDRAPTGAPEGTEPEGLASAESGEPSRCGASDAIAGDADLGEGAGCSVADLRAQLLVKEAEIRALRSRLSKAAPAQATRTATGRPLSIVIPMVGLGGEFAEAGYRYPKPLVNVVGRPILLWQLDRLSVLPGDSVFLAVPAVIDRQYGVSKLLSQEFRSLSVRVVTLPFETRGWVETVLAVVRQMSAQELRRPLVTLDCSTIYHGLDLLQRVRALPDDVGASVYFDIEGTTTLTSTGSVAAQFSYLRLDPDGLITDIREKTVISTSANTGAYIFKTARDFKLAAEKFLETPEQSLKSGLYASSLIASMLEEHERFIGMRVDHRHFAIVSTPAQLETFIHRVASGDVPMSRRMRFCFDLDGTLVTEPRIRDDLETCEPIPKAIALVRQLHAAGHTIIITTHRGMGAGSGVDTAIASVGHVTLDTLTKLGIPYTEIHFGKPHADVYIDAHSLNVQADIERDLGWYVGPKRPPSAETALEGAIDARAFNLVRAAGKAHVIKSSTPDVLCGECHWYRSIPQPLAHFFPTPIKVVDGNASADESAQSSITMSKVSGVTFAHLATSRLLMKSSVCSLVNVLHQIHTHTPEAGAPAAGEARASTAELCSNYASKVSKRFARHRALYESLGEELGIDTAKIASRLINFLEDFEAAERPQHAHYIHGDPVFSNVIRTDDDNIVLIDMRGELGSRLTTQGDVHYDLSKVYQSLCGYDFMLLDQDLDETVSEVFDGLRASFWEALRQLYPDVSHRDVRMHTAVHFFAIVPLHELRSRMARYVRTSYSMLHVEGLM